MMELIKRREEIISTPPETIIYVYHHNQPAFDELKKLVPNIKFTTNIFDIDDLLFGPTLVIIDDKMDELSNKSEQKYITNLYTRGSHHQSISVITLLQNCYEPGLRKISINSQYKVYFDQPMDLETIKLVGRRMYPKYPKFIPDAYEKATRNKFRYLFIFMHPAQNKKYRVRSSIFPEDCEVYVPS